MNIIYSQLLSQFPIRHGFLTKTYANTDQIIFPNQNHTNNVIIDNCLDTEADAILTTRKNNRIGIKTADCVPILIFEKNKHIAAAIHAGWQGTAGQIVKNSVQKILAMEGKPENIFASIGPAIGQCCYDISNERALFFEKKFLIHRNNRTFLDLKAANVQQLIDMDVPADNIESMAWCTGCNNDVFYSYRKEKPLVKQNVSFIELN